MIVLTRNFLADFRRLFRTGKYLPRSMEQLQLGFIECVEHVN